MVNFATKASENPRLKGWKESELVGKSNERLSPATYALPTEYMAMSKPSSLLLDEVKSALLPPSSVEYIRVLPDGFIFVTNASSSPGLPAPTYSVEVVKGLIAIALAPAFPSPLLAVARVLPPSVLLRTPNGPEPVFTSK